MVRKVQLAIKDSQRVKRILAENQAERKTINMFTKQKGGKRYGKPSTRRNRKSDLKKRSRFKPVCNTTTNSK
jgi:hypothetical protein